jgi:poly-gamma-glutamate capsule biosynthesis protein CapA/YwtB (metallophosphatase superfamily)
MLTAEVGTRSTMRNWAGRAGALLAWLVLLADLPAGGCALHPRGAPPSPPVVLVAGGDILLDRGVRTALEGTGNPDYPFEEISPIFREADLGLANLECSLVGPGVPIYKQFMFRGDPGMAPILRAAGLNALSLANNHAYDYGREALMETARHLSEAGIAPLGAGTNAEDASRARIVTIRGARLALLAFVDLELEGLLPLAGRPVPALADPEVVRARVSEARARADFVIVTMHWGLEYAPVPCDQQRRLAALLAGAGADLVIGHHPHVVQPYEWIGRTLVLYSLGNLVFDAQRPECEDGLLARIRIQSVKPELVWDAELIPIRIEQCRPRMAGPCRAIGGR